MTCFFLGQWVDVFETMLRWGRALPYAMGGTADVAKSRGVVTQDLSQSIKKHIYLHLSHKRECGNLKS